MNRRIHILQHVEYEGPAIIADWAKDNDFQLSYTRFFNLEKIPSIQDFDVLIIMGGPMGVYDSDKYKWLTEEIEFIKKCIFANKPVLGICLGAQLIAHALGSHVYKGPQKEIGWFSIKLADNLPFRTPKQMTVFHWHGDTFDLPENCKLFASSEGVINQAFIYNQQVIALQFHLEMNMDAIQTMILNSEGELRESGKYIMSENKIISKSVSHLASTNKLMHSILTYLSDRIR